MIHSNSVADCTPNQGRVLAPAAPPLRREMVIANIAAALAILDQDAEEEDMALEDTHYPRRHEAGDPRTKTFAKSPIHTSHSRNIFESR